MSSAGGDDSFCNFLEFMRVFIDSSPYTPPCSQKVHGTLQNKTEYMKMKPVAGDMMVELGLRIKHGPQRPRCGEPGIWLRTLLPSTTLCPNNRRRPLLVRGRSVLSAQGSRRFLQRASQEDTVRAKDQGSTWLPASPWAIVSCLMLMGISHQVILKWARTHPDFRAAAPAAGPCGVQTPFECTVEAVKGTT